ncbi:ion transporter [Pseudochryseolinea flava]|uniref:Ion transporter n=1 Tax=Pseudochryseolinea flava TaxID=2059302 RepID=A0A364Y2E2_9BACT|nr:ion transporter [Pseudochryseolinea flava]RAW01043.1 ion transporter [Pseudochryseolinea flava]
MTLRRRLYLTLEPTEKGGLPERIFEAFLIIIIILNIGAIVLDSVQEMHRDYQTFFYILETVSIVLFSCEYVLRIYSIVENPKYADPVKGRLRFMIRPMAIIDLLSFLPFYLAFLPLDLRVLRIFRLMVVFRLFKIARYLHALKIFRRVIADRKEQLVLSFIFILFILVLISFAMFYVEKDNPDPKNPFTSIPATMWWGIATLTTVGYGDMVPATPLGKTLGGLFAIAGVGLLALPAGILSSGFYELLHKEIKPEPKKCPHCGKDIHDHN